MIATPVHVFNDAGVRNLAAMERRIEADVRAVNFTGQRHDWGEIELAKVDRGLPRVNEVAPNMVVVAVSKDRAVTRKRMLHAVRFLVRESRH